MFKDLLPLIAGLAIALPIALADVAAAQAQTITGALDPFNPMPGFTPMSRTRFEVQVLGTTTQCSTLWGAVDCPEVVMPDGTTQVLSRA